ncbi:MAG: hypothetical protein WCY97_03680 [Methanothrix sp.]|jgi:hypothetical protein|uniref:Uncharacterized protein n=1 Tax=Methanothrix harundinacea TaxID=301375 RepID=A0A101IJR9_9EURY|nr:MAG: hypothetical protein APR56_09710 [Methanosaeta sp. SDB]KUK44857.1 MAG: Uncharacterized protein XD72_0756 [Methanothrix harundinacea]MDD2638847.1 hypothetical protein [Methanothrix sp.]MDI9397962.1 hypothetical protein [Euryarchaeota archaeon]KUK96393.1 MAG: Uncharacterized protein XE07_1151 [Methanothrix harundinacea]
MAEFLGMVENGEFRILEPREHCCTVRLTKLIKPSLPDSAANEKHQIDLSEDEGMAIMVEGALGKEELWVYEAKVTDRAGPILSATVRKIFG